MVYPAPQGPSRDNQVHWVTSNLRLHPWDEPIIRTIKAAKENNFHWSPADKYPYDLPLSVANQFLSPKSPLNVDS
jgi:hypothetical protein